MERDRFTKEEMDKAMQELAELKLEVNRVIAEVAFSSVLPDTLTEEDNLNPQNVIDRVDTGYLIWNLISNPKYSDLMNFPFIKMYGDRLSEEAIAKFNMMKYHERPWIY